MLDLLIEAAPYLVSLLLIVGAFIAGKTKTKLDDKALELAKEHKDKGVDILVDFLQGRKDKEAEEKAAKEAAEKAAAEESKDV